MGPPVMAPRLRVSQGSVISSRLPGFDQVSSRQRCRVPGQVDESALTVGGAHLALANLTVHLAAHASLSTCRPVTSCRRRSATGSTSRNDRWVVGWLSTTLSPSRGDVEAHRIHVGPGYLRDCVDDRAYVPEHCRALPGPGGAMKRPRQRPSRVLTVVERRALAARAATAAVRSTSCADGGAACRRRVSFPVAGSVAETSRRQPSVPRIPRGIATGRHSGSAMPLRRVSTDSTNRIGSFRRRCGTRPTARPGSDTA